MKLGIALLPILVCMLALPACAFPAPATTAMEATDAWVRTVSGMDTGSSGSTTALFMNIQNNGNSSDMLLKIESDVAKIVQIHLSEMDAKGVSSMHEVEYLEIPAGGLAELKPGGYPVMLMGLNREIKKGGMVTFTLTFMNAGTLTIETPVLAP